MVELNRKLLLQYKDIGIDWLVWWPCDEGGCGCHEDWPWGGKDFPRISTEMTAMAMEIYPKVGLAVQQCLSTFYAVPHAPCSLFYCGTGGMFILRTQRL